MQFSMATFWILPQPSLITPSASFSARHPTPINDTILHGDVLDIAPTLPDNSIRLVLCSPPYAKQRQQWYPSVPETEYPSWTVQSLEALRPKLLPAGG